MRSIRVLGLSKQQGHNQFNCLHAPRKLAMKFAAVRYKTIHFSIKCLKKKKEKEIVLKSSSWFNPKHLNKAHDPSTDDVLRPYENKCTQLYRAEI